MGMFQQSFNAEVKGGNGENNTDRTTSTAKESKKTSSGPKTDSFYSLLFKEGFEKHSLTTRGKRFVKQMSDNLRDFDNRFPTGILYPHRTVNLPARKGNKKSKDFILTIRLGLNGFYIEFKLLEIFGK